MVSFDTFAVSSEDALTWAKDHYASGIKRLQHNDTLHLRSSRRVCAIIVESEECEPHVREEAERMLGEINLRLGQHTAQAQEASA